MLSLIPKFALWPFVRPIASSKAMTAIAVGAGGLIARSTDGTTWSTPNSTVTTALHQAAYGGGVWMIVGAAQTVLVSTDDGQTWVKLVLPTTPFTGVPLTIASIVYDSGRFVIITSNYQLLYTTDVGVTWTKQTISGQDFQYFKKGRARRLSDGLIYQPGTGPASQGFTTFKWNGTSYDVGATNATTSISYIVQSMIAEGATYLTSQQQGGTLYRKKPADASWERTRTGVADITLQDGGAGYDAATDTFYQFGNINNTGNPVMYKGVAGTNWQTVDSATLNSMFGTGHILSDCGYVDKNSVIVGGNDIFFSSDWTTWAKAYTASQAISTVTVRSRTVSIGDFNRWKHFSFSGNEHIDDVTERFGIITGSPTLTNNSMVSTAAAEIALKDSLLFAANEDFTISIVINPTTALNGSLAVDAIICGVGNTGNDTPGMWYLMYVKNTTRFTFYYKTGGAYVQFASPAITYPINTDMHLEISRKSGAFLMFINGVKQVTTALTNSGASGPQIANTRGLGIGSPSGAYVFLGSRRNFFVDKGVCRHDSNFAPDTSVQTYTRPVYSAEDAKTIRAQIGFRRDGAIDEANDRAMRIAGSSNQVVQQGRMNFTGTQSAANGYQLALDPFGAGDFTIECCFTASVVGATAGFLLMAEWYLGTQTNDLNRWALLIGADRKAYFQMNRTAVGTDAVSVTSTVALTLNVSYKVIVERTAGVLSLYVLDAFSGALVNSVSAVCAFPIRGGQPRWLRNYSPGTGNYSGTGWIWDMRIADKAMYNGVPTVSATMPGMSVSKYTTAEEANIVSQATFSCSPRDEKSGALTTPTLHYSGYMNATAGFTWSTVTPAFSAGDFTIEGRFLIGTVGGNPTSLIGQFLNTSSNNAWQIRVINGFLGIVFSPTGQAVTGLITLVDTVAVVLGQEYYVVVERVGVTLTLYIDGVAKATTTYSGVLPATSLPIQRGDAGSGSVSLRDIRISKTSQYKGTVPKFPQYKQLNAIKPSITMGYFPGGTGTLYGYMENGAYSTTYISIGSCTHKLFRYTTGGNTIVRRLKGLFMDRGSYLILGWEDTTITPTSDMPVWTNNLVINGETFVNAGNPFSGFSTPLNGTSVYWGGVSAMNPLQEGREIAFEFV